MSDENLKKGRKKRGIRKYLPKILKELKEGLEPGKLDDRKGGQVPHATLYEIIGLLMEANMIYKEEGIYYYYWRKEFQEFDDSIEYETKLKHSEKLLVGDVNIVNRDEIKISTRKTFSYEYLIEHLKTGYPEIYEIYKKLSEIKSEREKIERLFSEEIRKKFGEKFEFIEDEDFEITPEERRKGNYVYLENIKDLIEKILKRRLKDFPATHKLKIQGGRIYSAKYDAGCLSDNENVIENLEKLILEAADLTYEIYSNLMEIRNEEKKLGIELKKKIDLLRLKVESGEPLKGYCKGCPKFRIKQNKKI